MKYAQRKRATPRPATDSAPRTLAVDIGGSGIKTMILSPSGEPLSDRLREVTPQPATPDAVIGIILQLAGQHVGTPQAFERVSVGFPGVIRQGVVSTATNLDKTWLGFDLGAALAERIEKPVRVANDATIQGFGAISGQGVELVVTLGTGMGSAVYVDGAAIPNLEMGLHPFHKGKTYEDMLGDAARRKNKKKWNKTLRKAIEQLDALFNYDRLFIGGGNATRIDGDLPDRTTLIPNLAGLTGGIALWRQSAPIG